MLKSLKKSCAALLLFVAGCATDKPSEDPKLLPAEGTIVSDFVKVGRYEVPLPAGAWIVSTSSVKHTAKVPAAKVILVQSIGKTASNAVVIETPLGYDNTMYSANSESKIAGDRFTSQGEAEVHSAIYTKSFHMDYANSKKKPRGLGATPSLMYIAPTKMKPAYYGKNFLEKTGLDYPADQHFFRVGYEFVCGPSKLFVSYFIDPRVENVLVTKGDIEASKWHPNRHYKLSPKDQVFLDKLENWAGFMMEELMASFSNRD